MAKNMKLEEVIQQLESLVGKLEEQECSLEVAMDLYKQGVSLLQEGTKTLDKIEKEIIVINEKNEVSKE